MPEPMPNIPVRSVSAELLHEGKLNERRRHPRHVVDASAKVFLVRVGSVHRGKIVDLSPSGCRIQTDERFCVGIYTRVEVEFYLEMLPFRLGGVIQAIHDSRTIGIRFLDVSERKRLQVAELIADLEKAEAAKIAAPTVPVADPAR